MIRSLPLPTSSSPFPAAAVPEIILDAAPGYADFHRRAWELAWEHVIEYPGAPRSPYMDEAHTPGRIWIWDSCFMALFCKYAPDAFPGVESFENFYKALYDGATTTLGIHHLDNPPLFAWVEWQDYLFTGRRERLEAVYRAGYLQRHYALMESLPLPKAPACADNETFFRKVALGYHWAGCPNGMDNTPRGGGGGGANPDNARAGYPDILWLDAVAQQALAAECIANIAGLFGDDAEAQRWRDAHRGLGELLNRHYWDEEDGIYYDILAAAPHAFYKVKTPAAFWPMLAGLCSPEQAERLAAHLCDPEVFGGGVPWPSLARNEPAFDPRGGYWRGGVWLPLAYMGVKALERYGFDDLADRTAETLVRHMFRTWHDYAPPTIWEAYSPTEPRPATHKRPSQSVRPDFCGWSALGPISLMIENVIGIRCDAQANTVTWRLRRDGRHGVRNLRFGGVTASLIHNGRGQVDIVASHPFFLRLDRAAPVPVAAGASRIDGRVSQENRQIHASPIRLQQRKGDPHER